jgi:hypothetical protein
MILLHEFFQPRAGTMQANRDGASRRPQQRGNLFVAIVVFVPQYQNLNGARMKTGDRLQKIGPKSGLLIGRLSLEVPLEFRFIIRQDVSPSRSQNTESGIDGGAIEVGPGIFFQSGPGLLSVHPQEDRLDDVFSILRVSCDAECCPIDQRMMLVKKLFEVLFQSGVRHVQDPCWKHLSLAVRNAAIAFFVNTGAILWDNTQVGKE